MPQDKIKALYDDVSKEYEVGTLDEFKAYLSDADKRSKFFDQVIKPNYDVADLATFESVYGLKKKEGSQPASATPSTPSAPSGEGIKPFSGGFKGGREVVKSDTMPFSGARMPTQGDYDAKKAAAEPTTPTDLREVNIEAPTEQRGVEVVVPQTEDFNARVYGNIAPNAKTPLNLAELEARYVNESKKVAQGETSPELIGIKNEIDLKYAALQDDYLQFLQSTNEDKYNNYASRLKTISEKSELTADDENFLAGLRKEALDIRMQSDKLKVDEIKKNTDLNTYHKRNELLRSEANKLQKELEGYMNPDGTLRSPVFQKGVDEVNAKLEILTQKQNQLKEETGVTDEVLTELKNTYDSIGNAELLEKGWNPYEKAKSAEIEKQLSEEARKDIAENGNVFQKSALLLMSFTDAIGSGTVSMIEAPKVLADALGYAGDYGWTDVLYDVSRDLNAQAEGRLSKLDSDSSVMNVLDVFAKGAGNVVQFAAGGEVGGAIKAGSKMTQNAGLVTTAFLMSEGQNYREALDAGIDPQEAALYATMISTAQALTETIVPDFQYFDVATRNSIMKAIKDGVGVKEAFKQYGKQLLVDVPKQGLKEIGEEVVTEVTGDTIKEGINALSEQKIYQDTFNPENYKDVALTAFVTGGGLTALKRGVRTLSPAEQSVAREVGENADKIIEDIIATQTTEQAGVAEEVGELGKIVKGLRNIPSYQSLGTAEKDFVVNKLMQKHDLEKSMKEAGMKDEATVAEIEKIESDINAVYRGKKVGETYKVEDAPEVLTVGDIVDFGKPTQTIIEETVEPVTPATPVAETVETIEPSTQEGIEEVKVEEVVPEKVSTPLEVFDVIENAQRAKKTMKGKKEAMVEAVKEYGEVGEKAIFVESNFKDIIESLKEIKDAKGNNVLKVKC